MGIRDWLKSLFVATSTVGAVSELPVTTPVTTAAAAPVPKESTEQRSAKLVAEVEKEYERYVKNINDHRKMNSNGPQVELVKKLSKDGSYGILYRVTKEGGENREIEEIVLVDTNGDNASLVFKSDHDDPDKPSVIIYNGDQIFPIKGFSDKDPHSMSYYNQLTDKKTVFIDGRNIKYPATPSLHLKGGAQAWKVTSGEAFGIWTDNKTKGPVILSLPREDFEKLEFKKNTTDDGEYPVVSSFNAPESVLTVGSVDVEIVVMDGNRVLPKFKLGPKDKPEDLTDKHEKFVKDIDKLYPKKDPGKER